MLFFIGPDAPQLLFSWLWSRPKASRRQSGAIPYAIEDGRVVFLLVTSKKGGRWIFPKGGIVDGMTAWDSAAKEAWEEAGIVGTVDHEPLGVFRGTDKGARADIELYALKVDRQEDKWPEDSERLRHWALLAETKRLLRNAEVARLAEIIDRRHLQSDQSRRST